MSTSDIKFDTEAPIVAVFINRDNYDTFAAAADEGAVYSVPSAIDLYGLSGLLDLQEIVDALLDCIGCSTGYTVFVNTKNHGYQPLADVRAAISPE